MPEKKAPDYTNSAENLCNPPEVGLKLLELQEAQNNIDALECRLAENETYMLLKAVEKRVSDISAQIKDMIDAQGSYQDIEAGAYAVKYRRMTKTYHPEKFFGDVYERFAPAVLTKAINVSALEGLIKGGLLSLEELKRDGVIIETPTYAYYIR